MILSFTLKYLNFITRIYRLNCYWKFKYEYSGLNEKHYWWNRLTWSACGRSRQSQYLVWSKEVSLGFPCVQQEFWLIDQSSSLSFSESLFIYNGLAPREKAKAQKWHLPASAAGAPSLSPSPCKCVCIHFPSSKVKMCH